MGYQVKIIELPNPPIIIALGALLISKITVGIPHRLGSTIFTIAIIVWAYLEIFKGDNWFRRILGAVVMLGVAYSLFKQLN